MPGELDTFLQRFLPAILLLLAVLLGCLIFLFLPKGKAGRYKPNQESHGGLRE